MRGQKRREGKEGTSCKKKDETGGDEFKRGQRGEGIGGEKVEKKEEDG